MPFRFPLMLRSTYEAEVRGLAAASVDALRKHALDAGAQYREHAEKVAGLERTIANLTEERDSLKRANAFLAKVLAVLCRRAAVRVSLEDLRAPMPEIRMEEEEHARKPTLRITALYRDDRPSYGSQVMVTDAGHPGQALK